MNGAEVVRRIKYFNPLPLYRGRQHTTTPMKPPKHFNPLPLYRGRQKKNNYHSDKYYFNPLPLYRGRHAGDSDGKRSEIFQSTSSIQRKTANINK